jgi:hypothetical protein
MNRLLLIYLFTFIPGFQQANAQVLSNLRSKNIAVDSDSVKIDSVSIVPGSVQVFDMTGERLDSSCFKEDWLNSRIIFSGNCRQDSIKIIYRVLTFTLGEYVQHKDRLKLVVKGSAPNPFQYAPSSTSAFNLFPERGIMANGNISRGITFGNNQDVFVNSSLNLQLNGKLGNDVELLAAITDENIPVQPEGNTQQLQEFDKVFIQFSKDRNKLIAGDFELRRPDSYFMNFFKRGQGALASGSFSLCDTALIHKRRQMNTSASLAIAKGRFSRMVFQGTEGNQGPYRLIGSAGESFIIVLSGTEKVFIDGQLMTRGMQNDYVIDYNTAEITFMPKRLITKDVRIIVEFEYSDRNYVRSMYFLNNEFESDRVKLKFNLYSEQDSKNQPLLQDVDSSRKAVMAEVGDSINQAYIPTADSLSSFDETRVLYIKKDSLLLSGNTYSIFIYSTDQNQARWQVNFSDVGAGKGDYIQDIRSANGRVFKWVAPVNGISQGNFMPVQLLVTPKLRRMITAGADIKPDNKSNFSVEAALSDNDINLFSSAAKANDQGYGLRLHLDRRTRISTDTVSGWSMNSRVDYEFAGKNFRALEPYRPAEFTRDWNTTGIAPVHDEHILSAEAGFENRQIGRAGYTMKTYLRGSQYSGWNHGLYADVQHNGFTLKGTGSFLKTEGSFNRTQFIRHQFDLGKLIFRKIRLGVKENAENNRYLLPESDSLSGTSYSWQEWTGYAAYNDSVSRRLTLSAKHRFDRGVKLNNLIKSAEANELALVGELNNNSRNNIKFTSNYRDLKILDTTLITTPPLQTLVNRIDHQLTLLNGAVNAITFYEISSGRDRKQEFYYLEVPAGQGTYAYIGDLNGNNVQDLNEFALANFTDQAKYIRVFFNSDDYVATRSNSFSEVLNLNPASLKQDNKPLRFWQRFSNQLIIRLDKKTTGENLISALNPFSRDIKDSLLVSANSNLRNTVYFNRSDPGFGADYTWQINKNKALLVNGFDARQLTSQQINLRWNTTTSLQTNLSLEQENRYNSSDFFSDRNYDLLSHYIEPKATYQPTTRFRLITAYRLGRRQNREGMFEKLREDRMSIEARLNTINSGSLNAKVNFIKLDYTGNRNSYLAYEMLGGLQPGTNYTWTLSLLKNLNNIMQFNLNYEGRKSSNAKVVHTGGVQFRAFF